MKKIKVSTAVLIIVALTLAVISFVSCNSSPIGSVAPSITSYSSQATAKEAVSPDVLFIVAENYDNYNATLAVKNVNDGNNYSNYDYFSEDISFGESNLHYTIFFDVSIGKYFEEYEKSVSRKDFESSKNVKGVEALHRKNAFVYENSAKFYLDILLEHGGNIYRFSYAYWENEDLAWKIAEETMAQIKQ